MRRLKRHGPVLNQNGMPNEATIGGQIISGGSVRVHCNAQGCNHSRTLDLRQLGRHLGYEHGSLRTHLVPLFRCSRCNGRDVGLIVIPDYDAPKAPQIAGRSFFDPENLYRKAKES